MSMCVHVSMCVCLGMCMYVSTYIMYVCTLPLQPPHTTTIVITGDTRAETCATSNDTTIRRISQTQKLTRKQAMDRVRNRIHNFSKTYCISEQNVLRFVEGVNQLTFEDDSRFMDIIAGGTHRYTPHTSLHTTHIATHHAHIATHHAHSYSYTPRTSLHTTHI